MFETLGALHALDYARLGLADYGRPANYIQRQISRWRRQSEMLATDPIPYMAPLMDWLQAHAPSGDETSLVHGDFRIGNLMLHPSEPKIVAVLDWELSTLGHPLADVAYSCTVFHTPQGYGAHYSGYAGVDLSAHGLMGEAECLDIYCRRSGRRRIENWDFYLGFSMLRSAGIAHGVYARALAGNAADTSARELQTMAKVTAELGWALVNRT
jgi:aminoglycoside phosphotransferase (APT) family kinase protein